MNAWNWLDNQTVRAIHLAYVSSHGGRHGVRDEQLLRTAVGAPQKPRRADHRTVHDVGSSYATNIIRHRPFIEGNDRTAMLAAFTFLELNDVHVSAMEEEAAIMFQALAAGEVGEAELARWLERNSVAAISKTDVDAI